MISRHRDVTSRIPPLPPQEPVAQSVRTRWRDLLLILIYYEADRNCTSLARENHLSKVEMKH